MAFLLSEKAKRKRHNKLATYRPYAKQRDFHAAGAVWSERLLLAGNQVGKTVSAGFETAMHLTGQYPEWWQGKRFDSAVNFWAGGVTNETTRDTIQRILMGRPNDYGSGAIPGTSIVKLKPARGVADFLDTIWVLHASGDISTLALKSYEKGREKWQGETLDGVWFDEEPPIDIYTEGLTRTNATGQFAYLTFTPLLGMSDVVHRFYGTTKEAHTHTTMMTIDDAEHYSPEQRAKIIASYPRHEREARSKGIPVLGSGRVFVVPEEDISEGRIDIPSHWPRLVGMDFGADHPTAAVWVAWDRDTDIMHIYDAYRRSDNDSDSVRAVNLHGPVIISRGKWIPVAWPHDGLQHDKGSGEQVAAQYRNLGVNMLPERVTFEDGSNGFEAGLVEMTGRLETGRLKVADHLTEWFEEYRLYHREKGLVVKIKDDLLSATRYAMMGLRFAALQKSANVPKLPQRRFV